RPARVADFASGSLPGDAVSAARGRICGVGECGGEEAVGPVFGVAAGVGEDEVHFGVSGLEAGELVAEPAAVDVLEEVAHCFQEGLAIEVGERALRYMSPADIQDDASLRVVFF